MMKWMTLKMTFTMTDTFKKKIMVLSMMTKNTDFIH